MPSARWSRFALAAALALVPFAGLTTLVLVTAPGVFGPDARALSVLHGPVLHHPWLADLMRLISVVTDPLGVRLAALVVALGLWRREQGRAALWLVVTVALGGLLGVVLKQIFARTRPEWPEPITVASGYSFPSGHALNSMLAVACVVVLVHELRPGVPTWVWPVAGGYVALVGCDRMLLGVHYPTDVLAGWSLAIAVTLAATAAFGGRINRFETPTTQTPTPRAPTEPQARPPAR